MSATIRTCPVCGSPLPGDAPRGLCPKCLLAPRPAPTAPASRITHHASRTLRYFGDYELLEEIARGGMGVVYKARQVSLNRTVAVKMILSGQLASAGDVQRFHHEAEAAANLQHPNIVAIHEVGEHEGQHYFSMDFVEGRSLADVVSENPLSAARAAAYVKTIAEAVHYAHQRGVVHRDLKPSNVLIDQNDQPRVTDFGLAKRVESQSELRVETNTPAGGGVSQLSTQAPLNSLTLTGQVLGTPAYMSPEQASGKGNEVGPLSDVYSLGATLYELLVGHPPFHAETPVETMVQVVNAEPVSPRLVNPSVPRDLATITLKCLEKDFSRRYRSAQDVADELTRFLRHEPIRARPTSVAERAVKWAKRRPAIAGLFALLALALSAGVCGICWQWRKTEAARRTQEYESYVAKIGLAAAKLDGAAFSRAEELLLTCPPHLRHWEWGRLKALCRPESRVLTMGNPNIWKETEGEGIYTVAFSPDGSLVVTGKSGREAGMAAWEAASGTFLGAGGSGPDPVNGIVFSPDGKWLLTDQAAALDPRSGTLRPERLFKTERADAVVSMAGTSADGRRIVTIEPGSRGSDANAIVWDVGSRQQISALRLGTNRVSFLVLSPKGDRLLTEQPNADPVVSPGQVVPRGGVARRVTKVWETATAREVCSLNSAGVELLGAVFSPDATRVFIVSTTNGARGQPSLTSGLWDATTGQSLPGLDAGMVDLPIFSPDGTRLLGRGRLEPTVASLWEVTTGKKVTSFTGHSDTILGLAFSRDGRRVVTGGADRTARVWDVMTGREVRICAGHEKPVRAVTFSPDGERIVAAHAIINATIWEVSPPVVTVKLGGHPQPVSSAWFSPDGKRVMTVDGWLERTVRVWDAASGQELFSPAHPGRIESILPFDGRRICTVCRVDTNRWDPSTKDMRLARAFDSSTGKELFTLRRPHLTRFSPDERHVLGLSASVNKDSSPQGKQEVRLWDIETGQETLLAGGTNDIEDAAFSGDGKRVAAVSVDHVVSIWEASTGHLLAKFPYASNVVCNGGYFLPGDRFIVTQAYHTNRRDRAVLLLDVTKHHAMGSIDGSLLAHSLGCLLIGRGLAPPEIWDTATRKEICRLKGHAQAVTLAAFLPDGQRVLTASGDKTVKLWDTQTGRELLTLSHDDFVTAIAVSPDGRHVLTASAGGGTTIWTAGEWKTSRRRTNQ